MSDDRIDPELLAAFLEGTVTPEEREGVLRTLAKSKSAYASFVEASAIHRELTGANSDASPEAIPATVTPLAGRPRHSTAWSRPRYVVPGLLAAGIAAIVLTRAATNATREPARVAELVEATSLTRAKGSGALTRNLGAAWDQPPWSVTRGAEPTPGQEALAFRTGVRFAQLEVAAQSLDTSAVTRAAEAVADLVSTTQAGAPLSSSIRGLSREPDFGGRAGRAATARRIGELVGAVDWFDLGTWCEAARLAVMARDAAFFDPRGAGGTELRRIVGAHTAAAASEWQPVVDALRPLLADRTPNDMSTIGASVNAAMAAAAR